MPVLIATRTVRIGRVEYKEGDSFEVPEKDAKTWIAIKKARLSDSPEMPKAVNLPKEVMSRKPVKEVAVEDEAPKPKRAYHRRDMMVEEPVAASPTAVKPMTFGQTGEDEPSQS